MFEPSIKVCPDCGSEFQQWVEMCVDCGKPLVHPAQIEPRKREPSLIPADRVHLRTAPPSWIQALSEDLDRAGIEHWIQESDKKDKNRGDRSLYVALEDWEAACPIDDSRYELEVPDADMLTEAVFEDPEDPHRTCPACGERQQEGAIECPECGLALGQTDCCPNCKREFDSFVWTCPGCGLELFARDEGEK
ncbi:MAG TPA: hypothetical protein VN493_15505 [Thermoanaerobaculia bacterium]|nr:hypothetical protein [Thermoanaerobaculia bacterium]